MTNPIEKAGKVLADSGVCPSPVAKNERTSARRAEIDAVIQLQASVRDLMSKIKNPAAKGQIDSLLLSLPPEYLSINQLEILKSEVQDAKNAANEAKEKDDESISALGLIAGAIGKVCDMFRSNDEEKAKCEHHEKKYDPAKLEKHGKDGKYHVAANQLSYLHIDGNLPYGVKNDFNRPAFHNIG